MLKTKKTALLHAATTLRYSTGPGGCSVGRPAAAGETPRGALEGGLPLPRNVDLEI